jgi:S-formylglutathione hydrolase FrmB
METAVSVLVPNARLADDPARPLKAGYLLHGLCGRSSDWIDFSQLAVYAEKYDMAFIMPEVARSFYRDMKLGQRYFTFVSQELPAMARRVFNISDQRQDTMIFGASMGGYGALSVALAHPEQYGCCGAFAPACLFLGEGLEYQRKHGSSQQFIDLFGTQLIKDFQAIFGPELRLNSDDDIMELLRGKAGASDALPLNSDMTPSIFMACGTEDPMMLSDNRRFVQEVSHLDHATDLTYREWKGGHDWIFFNQALKAALAHFLGC